MKKTRQWHLWIGLVTTIVLLLEAVTGLLLTERWLLGEGGGAPSSSAHSQHQGENLNITDALTKASQTGKFSLDEVSVVMNHGVYMAVLNDDSIVTISPSGRIIGEEKNSLSLFIRRLHAGQINGVNIKWIIDLSAISIIFLTITGIFLSVRVLRAQHKSRLKKLAEAKATV